MTAPPVYTVDVPGAFETFFTCTGTYVGQRYSNDPDLELGSQKLRQAWLAAKTIKRGRGHTIRLECLSAEAAVVLAEYAHWCLSANSDEPDYSEVAAARTVHQRVETATGGRVKFNGFYVTLDDTKVVD